MTVYADPGFAEDELRHSLFEGNPIAPRVPKRRRLAAAAAVRLPLATRPERIVGQPRYQPSDRVIS